MASIVCYDANGNKLEKLTQWDVNQTLVVKGAEVSSVPVFHFCNKNSKAALVVTSTVNGDEITTKIPNTLLQYGFPIIAYMYYESADGSAKTCHTIIIPVLPRVKPADYEYVENIDYVSLATIDERLSTLQELIDALAPVATSGNYDDLTNKPIIPAPVTEQTVRSWGFTKNTGTYSKPTGGIPKADLAAAVQTSLGKADTALQEHQSLAAYRTAAAQDVIDSGKVDKVTGKGLSSNDYTATAKAKVDAIPANPKYTDTVYDDTALKERVATIEGKESAWDAKSDFSGSYNDLTDKPTIPTALPNPNALTFTGAVTGNYDGSAAMTVNIPSAVTDDHINSLIDAKLGVIENGSY